MNQRGIGATQLVVSMVVLGLLVVFLLYYVAGERLFAPSHEDRLPAGFVAQQIYTKHRLEGLSAKLMLFQQSFGKLPGDLPGGVSGRVGGDGDGRVETDNGEKDHVALDLYDAGAIPEPRMRFMKHEMEFYWVTQEVFPDVAPGHYFVVYGLDEDLAGFLDAEMDDGQPDTGRIKRVLLKDGRTEFYYRFSG